MFYRNFKKTKNIARDVKTKDELNKTLDEKSIITTYRVSENSLFFAKFFKNNPEKIKAYYEDVLLSIKSEFSLSDTQIVDATIHFDQTSPHLHLAISNLYIKYNKEFEKNFF